MSVHSVPCWCFLDKDFAAFVSGDATAGLPIPLLSQIGFIPLPHHDDVFPRSPWRLTTTPEESVNLDNLLMGKNIGRSDLKSLPFLSPVPPMHSSTGAQLFGGRGALFREKHTCLLDEIQVNFIRKTVLRPSLTVRKPSDSMGAPFREK